LKRFILYFVAALLSSAFASAQNPVADLDRKIREGKVEIKYDDAQGYLRSLLEALKIPIESQIAVYSKTSVQSLRIEPNNPRTLFFNDQVIVGWVRSGFIEVLVQDPKDGLLFYTVDQRLFVHQARLAKSTNRDPLFQPRLDCQNCHTQGTLVRSVMTGPTGVPLAQTPVYDTDHRTPFDQLWGGWYVTGSSGSAHHIGNTTPAFDTSRYLSPHSDIVALMVFEHQMQMMNLLVRAAKYGSAAANELVDYMLFIDEPSLADEVSGTSGFAEKFSAEGPFDSKGRSLRQLDLKHHLLRYPCSYMIYTPAFDGLPAEVKDAVYRRLWSVLSGEEKDPKYARSTRTGRQAILEILRDTKKDLPRYFATP
jgi:hypothetical protein